jgi:hypothetical protein
VLTERFAAKAFKAKNKIARFELSFLYKRVRLFAGQAKDTEVKEQGILKGEVSLYS